MKSVMNYINRHSAADIVGDDDTRKHISQVLFYICLAVYMTASLLQYTSIKTGYPEFNKLLTQIIGYCIFAAIVNVILFADYSLLQLVLYVVMMILLYHSYKNAGTRLVYQGFVIALSARQVEWKQLRKVLLYGFGVFIVAGLILYAAGVLTTFEYYKGERMRLILGYNHPNVLGCMAMTLGLIWAANYAKRHKLRDYLVLAALAAFCWFGPMSRTSAISIAFAILVMLIAQLWGERLLDCMLARWLLSLFAPLCFLLIFGLSYFYTPESVFFQKINAALSGRVAFGHAFLDKYLHTWMGQKIKMVGTAEAQKTGKTNMYLDSAYMRLYVSIGIIGLLILLFVMIAAMLYAIRMRDWGMIIGLLAYGIYGISEVYMMYVFFNVFLMGVSYGELADVRLLVHGKEKHENL